MEKKAYRYVIVGGGLAGASAAEGIRELDPEGSVIIIGQEARPPYHRPPVSKGILLGSKKPEDTACKAEAFYRDNKITLETGVSGKSLDPASREVTLDDGRVLSYEKLLLATGSRARRLPLPGADLQGIHTLRTLDDALALVNAMKGASTAVVIGGSYIGAESASALAQNGIRTTMIFPEDRLLDGPDGPRFRSLPPFAVREEPGFDPDPPEADPIQRAGACDVGHDGSKRRDPGGSGGPGCRSRVEHGPGP